MTTAHINRIATAVPPHDVHGIFVRFARTLPDEPRARPVFDRMAAKAQIAHRFSVRSQAADAEGVSDDTSRVYSRGRFPTTSQRMQLFEKLAGRAVPSHGRNWIAVGSEESPMKLGIVGGDCGSG